MDKHEQMLKALQDKKAKHEEIKGRYKGKEKVKKLTQDERIARIEEMLGLV